MNIENKIVEMAELIIDRRREERGFPVAALFFDKNNNTTIKATNSKGNFGNTDTKTHAEHICLSSGKFSSSSSYSILVSIPPCLKCLNEIINSGHKIESIYYLTKQRSWVRTKEINDLTIPSCISLKQIKNGSLKKQYKVFSYYLQFKIHETLSTLKEFDNEIEKRDFYLCEANKFNKKINTILRKSYIEIKSTLTDSEIIVLDKLVNVMDFENAMFAKLKANKK